MPTYEYACSECGERFEAVQRITDDPLKVCQMCGAEAIKRVIFPVGIMFKGSGFHINDYKGPKGSNGDSEKGKDGKEAAADGAPKESPKPEAAKEPAAASTGSDSK
ncbi:MAG: hypothetical protein IT210_17465 [Armatimonadetes bacterium]|nr:hypothetical protein [Armatimonadota bacterium]